MPKTKSILSLVFVGLLVLVMSGFAADVTGEWEMTTEGRRGPRTITIKFAQDGENLKVTMPGRGGEESVYEGTVKGNDIEWKVVRETQRGTFEMTYKGTIDGDTIKGTMVMGERESSWTAKKK